MKIACCFEKKEGKSVKCSLCPHGCLISDGKAGICGARQNKGGELYTLNYGVISGMSYDPIEKKPFYHYYPSSEILSIGTVGCNLHCPFCQNFHISRYFDDPGGVINEQASPADIVGALEKSAGYKGENLFRGVSYTYSEPMVWYEFVMDTAALMKEKGYKNVLVTNGFISKEPLKELLPLVDAANIDLKAFTESNYRRLGGRLAPVLDNISAFREAGVHVEITTLVVTGLNDDMEELEKLAGWIAGLDPSIPYHISRYFPRYLYKEKATDTNLIERVKEMAGARLVYVYTGNMEGGSDTFCPGCGGMLVARRGYAVSIRGIKNGRCSSCGRKADFIM